MYIRGLNFTELAEAVPIGFRYLIYICVLLDELNKPFLTIVWVVDALRPSQQFYSHGGTYP